MQSANYCFYSEAKPTAVEQICQKCLISAPLLVRHSMIHTCLTQREIIFAVLKEGESELGGRQCVSKRRRALIQRRVMRSTTHRSYRWTPMELTYTVTELSRGTDTHLYHCLGLRLRDIWDPLGRASFLLSRNSWSFCFTWVLATAPVRR